MLATCFEEFRGPITVADVANPVVGNNGVVIAVRAAGVCRSDWHGWQGHDADIRTLPHVPGHEFAGEVVEVGRDVRRWRVGDRVTMPFVAGCGTCRECTAGAAQVCDRQFQPGFTAWGAFAEAVAVPFADYNLVALPESLDFVTAAALGCRLATAYRAVALQGRVKAGEWVAVYGCGGVGLSAIMVAAAIGGRTIAVDVRDESLALAKNFGAEHSINATSTDPVVAVHELSNGGVELSLDALGSGATAANSIKSLRKRGRHVQVGLLAGSEFQPRLPMELVIGRELELYGSHGLAAADYQPLLNLLLAGKLPLSSMVKRRISLAEAPAALAAMDSFGEPGITVIDRI